MHLQVRKITTRVNTVNGRVYSKDPTIFSWCAASTFRCIVLCARPLPRPVHHNTRRTHLTGLDRGTAPLVIEGSADAAARRACRELCNECHTNDNYELNNNIQPGSLLYNWQGRQAAFLKHTIGVKQV